MSPISDDDTTNGYIKYKLPEWHERLRAVEEKCNDLPEIKTMVREIYVAFTGTPDGKTRGINFRLGLVESWKKTIGWAIGVLYVAVVTACVAMVIKTKNGG